MAIISGFSIVPLEILIIYSSRVLLFVLCLCSFLLLFGSFLGRRRKKIIHLCAWMVSFLFSLSSFSHLPLYFSTYTRAHSVYIYQLEIFFKILFSIGSTLLICIYEERERDEIGSLNFFVRCICVL